MEKNNCENCGKKTSVKGFWGIHICRNCTKKYNEATKLAVQELVDKHQEEFEKIRANKLDLIFKEKDNEMKNEK